LGTFFWFILAKFTTPEIIGISSTLVSISVIFMTISLMAVPTGIQRLLSKSFSEKLIGQAKVFVGASVLLVAIGLFVTSIILLAIGDSILANYEIDSTLVFIAILLVASSCFTALFRAVVISSLKTKILPVIMIVSGIVKIGLAIILISVGMEAIGVMIGFTSFFILSSILLAVNLIMIFKSSKEKSEINVKNAIRNIFSASVVSWIPALITVPGIYLGTIVVFGIEGASQAGIYFIAFSVATALTTLMLVLLTLGYPLLSSMKDGRKRLVWRLMKMSLVFGLPIVSIIMFYPNDILQVFGKDYLKGSFALEILLVSMLPLVVASGVRILSYAYGNYRQVLAIGLGLSLPRIFLYFILVPIFGNSGAALSFTIGSIVGLIVSIVIAKRMGLNLFGKDLFIIFIIPTILAYTLSYFEIHLALSIFVIVLLPYILFIRFGIITRDDLQDTLGVLPKNIATPTLNFVNRIAQKLNSSY